VAGNQSGFTSGNPNAPDGTQVGFLQTTGSFSQSVNFSAGTYQISFLAAQRGNWQASSQTFEVMVDGTVVGSFNPGGTNYAALTTNSFSVTAGMHTITFAGLDPNGGDNTAFLDQVSINAVSSAPAFADAGFEAPNVGTGTYNAFQYYPTGTPWTFYSGGVGVAGNGSGFTAGNPNAPEGTQVGFLQGNGAMSQSVSFPAGTYTISFLAAQRGNWQASSQTFQVTVDGTVVGTFTPAGTSYAPYTTNAFSVTAGAHTIAFVGLNPNGGDNTAFVDKLSITTVAAPTVGGASFETPDVGTGTFSAFQYAPSGTSWTFNGSAGVAGNGSGFTSGNPNAPDGTQVGFLQGTGSFSQSINFSAGTYQIGFLAAQRGNWQASSQTFEVMVDGTAVGTFTPAGTSYAALTTNSFTVSAGPHTIVFFGLNPNGGDNTAFIDDVSIKIATS
jgi:hypothetical protein